VADSLVQKIKMDKMRELVGNLALTNYFLIDIPLTPKLRNHLQNSYGTELGDIDQFVRYNLGYLCFEASLPTSSFATAEVKDNFMGITQEFAHTRLYTDMDLSFYVDSNYKTLRFFEGWMDYVSGGNSKELNEPAAASDPRINIYRRFNYPNDYKCPTMKIFKFERDLNQQITYTVINAFPKGMTSIPISYGAADILKLTVTFNYDRYLTTKEKIESPSPSSLTAPEQPLQLDARALAGVQGRFQTLTDKLNNSGSLNDIELDELYRLTGILRTQTTGNAAK